MKKVLSIFLATAMLISLIPAVFAADTEINVTYDFSGKFEFNKKYADLTYDVCTNWEYAGLFNSSREIIGENDTGVRASKDEKNIRVQGNKTTEDYWIAFKLKIDTATDYSMKIKVASAANPTYARIDAYIFKTDTVSAVADGIIEANKLSASGLNTAKVATELPLGTTEQLPTGKKTFEQGEYYFVFRPVTTDDLKTTGWVTLYSLTLDGTIAAEPDDDQVLTNAFDAVIDEDIEYTAPTVTGVTVGNDVIKSTPGTVAGAFNLTADAEKDGKNFLYWVKAMDISKKIISFSNELTNYMPGVNDKNDILIAVYEGDVPDQEEWYNANGQRIATGAQPKEYPSMAGYGTAEGWDDYADMNIHVARYALEQPEKNIDITVTGGEGTDKYAYGDTVTCTASGDNFKCWTKTDINGNTEIVSVDEVYTFQAWETCTVEAMYDENYTYNGNTMKIIIDTFTAGNEKAVMAEFIGFGADTVEKGIIYNNETKIAMTKPGNQFTVTGNAGDTFKGYAIVKDGEEFNLIVDGEATISNVAE